MRFRREPARTTKGQLAVALASSGGGVLVGALVDWRADGDVNGPLLVFLFILSFPMVFAAARRTARQRDDPS